MIITELHQVETDLDEMIEVLQGDKQTLVPIRRLYALELHRELKQKRDALNWIAETISGWRNSGYLQYGKWAQEDDEFECLWRLLDLLVPFEDAL